MLAGAILVFMLLLLFVGMPVGFAMGVAGTIGLYFKGGLSAIASILSNAPYRSAANFALSTVPMFIFMAEIISRANIVPDVFTAAQRWLGRTPGGLAIATVIASAGMGAMSGSSTAAAACMSSIAVPEMRRAGYSLEMAAGVVTVAGTLAIMIPPSIPLVIYGLVTETSIGKLLIAGILPGIMTAAIYSIGLLLWRKLKPEVIPAGQAYSYREKFASLRPLWAFLILASVVIVTLYAGIGTPTEAAAIGAFGAAAISLATRRLDLKGLYAAALQTAKITTMIFTIIIGAMVCGYFFTLTQATQKTILFISSLHIPPWFIMGLIAVLYLILGCIMDQIAILLLTLPLTFPLVTSLGYDPIWFGIIATKLAEIGLVTPPVGMNAYVVSATIKAPLEQVFKGTGVMLMFEFVTLCLLLAFPMIATWLPSFMK
ncbi:TRAP dicarboxylate transporter, DctM subunit [Desulfofundulus kuznetsovii DSM 6115]|uniref:TRAP dicarboxylate transporter, DctM subunit n=1 Tax=Desulfofundulus kuznetsovii (strain DSM 6115 / VKM B-1805 / 17) TaxID=760568 RepID=A0AAU8PFJ6_DESK7|nr:TRAP dicarboxylate transporter, DctM subunit [Desulfofundulus kuznetsovii DSM 6115]